MAKIVFIKKQSLKSVKTLIQGLSSMQIVGEKYILYTTDQASEAETQVISELSYSTKLLSSDIPEKTSKIPISSISSNFSQKKEFFIECFDKGENSIFIENDLLINYFASSLKIKDKANKECLAVFYSKPSNQWVQTIIAENQSAKDNKEINTEEKPFEVYAYDIINKSSSFVKEKIVNFELVRRNSIEANFLLFKSQKKLEESQVKQKIQAKFQEKHKKYEEIKNLSSVASQLNKEIQDLTQKVAQFPISYKQAKNLDFSKFLKPVTNFSKDFITLSENQSENRTFHLFSIKNERKYELKDLKLYIKSNKKCLQNFNLNGSETLILKLNYEYDLLMELGTFIVEVISCSLTMSNQVTISLLEVKMISQKDFCLHNRFVTQKNCKIVVNSKVYQENLTILHFGSLEVELPGLVSNSYISVHSENDILISNILRVT